MDLLGYKEQNRHAEIIPFKHSQVQLGCLKSIQSNLGLIKQQSEEMKDGANLYTN